MAYLHQIPRIRESLEFLLKKDPVFKRLGIKPHDLDWPYYGPGFSGLVRIVIGQQISTFAADALWKRFVDGVHTVSPNSILILKNEDMRALGLSHQKAKYIRELADAVKKNKFDPEALEDLPDAAVAAAITALHGFGPWSAEMYLMFCLARPDVWPAGDLGIQMGLQRYLALGERPDHIVTRKEGARFSPHSTAASLLMWYMKKHKEEAA